MLVKFFLGTGGGQKFQCSYKLVFGLYIRSADFLLIHIKNFLHCNWPFFWWKCGPRRIKTRLRDKNRNSSWLQFCGGLRTLFSGEFVKKKIRVVYMVTEPKLQREIAEWHHKECKNPRFGNFVKSDILRCLVKFRASKCILRVVTRVERGWRG